MIKYGKTKMDRRRKSYVKNVEIKLIQKIAKKMYFYDSSSSL